MRSLGLGVLCVGWLGACAPHRVAHEPTPPLAVPSRYAGAEQTAERTSAQHQSESTESAKGWWHDFADPQLNQLVTGALADNFNVQGAWARLRQAAAAADIAGAPRVPSLGASLGATYQRLNLARFGVGGSGLDLFGFAGSLEAGYEVDFWSKISDGEQAALLDQHVAADQVQVVAMTVAAEVAEAYYDVLAARAGRLLLEQQRAVSASLLELVELRFGEGLATGVEVSQQRQQVLGADSALAPLVAVEAVARHRLAALLGKQVGCPGAGPAGGLEAAPEAQACVQLPESVSLPQVPPPPRTGVPAELLKRRPDLRAAQRQVEAADYRVAVAVADRYPSVQLTGSVSSEPSRVNDWLLSPLWNLAANLTLPLVDGGRRRAEVERRRAVMAELVASYGQAVLDAMMEVENALIQQRQQRQTIANVQAQLDVARLTLEQAQLRYGQGTADFVAVLTALRSQQDVERALLDAQRQLISYHIQLCRALGGTWTASLEDSAQEAS